MSKSFITACSLIILIFGCQSPKLSEQIDLNELTIDQIHQNYIKGHYTSEQLVLAYLERIERLDTITNALTILNPNAISIAKELDEEYKKK